MISIAVQAYIMTYIAILSKMKKISIRAQKGSVMLKKISQLLFGFTGVEYPNKTGIMT